MLVQADADHWKTWVHQRLITPLNKPGAMTLFDAQPSGHARRGRWGRVQRRGAVWESDRNLLDASHESG
jgi:hypothetical protein